LLVLCSHSSKKHTNFDTVISVEYLKNKMAAAQIPEHWICHATELWDVRPWPF